MKKKSKFIIIGPDDGIRKNLENLIDKMNLSGIIEIYNYMEFSKIKRYAASSSFFIQLSSFEGMAMSVSESMQFGLIPVVTNVGQIKKYCINLENSFICSDNDNEIVRSIRELISSPEKFTKMREKSIQTWRESSTYKDDIISSFKELLD